MMLLSTGTRRHSFRLRVLSPQHLWSRAIPNPAILCVQPTKLRDMHQKSHFFNTRSHNLKIQEPFLSCSRARKEPNRSLPYSRTDSSDYKIKEEPLGINSRQLRVIIIGAGVSGLNTLVQLKKHISSASYTIYEKNSDVGGTWFENRYPGCASDDPSHSYQFSHSPNPR